MCIRDRVEGVVLAEPVRDPVGPDLTLAIQAEKDGFFVVSSHRDIAVVENDSAVSEELQAAVRLVDYSLAAENLARTSEQPGILFHMPTLSRWAGLSIGKRLPIPSPTNIPDIV